MPNKVELTNQHPSKSVESDKISSFVENVLEKLEKQQWEVSITFCDDGFIAKLNREYRKKDGATDVLSFEQGDSYKDENDVSWFCAGDIIISLDTLQENSKYFNVPCEQELYRLLIHGILHLNGMDHSDNSQNQPMLVLQEEILTQIKKD
ncbi:MAG: rRNA maturation RNase YbeY [Treponemataceae bacterium]